MHKIESYDDVLGNELVEVFDPHDIIALQMAGVPDNDIATLDPDHFMLLLDRVYGEYTYETYLERQRYAKIRISKFWKRDTEDAFAHLVRENNCLYYVETSASASKLFKEVGAIPVPCTMVKYLLNNEQIVPATDGIRYMHQEQETPNQSAWKTMYMFSSLEVYDKAFIRWFGNMDMSIDNRKDATALIAYMYDQTSEPQLYERFYQCGKVVSQARNLLEDLTDRTKYEDDLLHNYSKYYLEYFPELETKDIPSKYLK